MPQKKQAANTKRSPNTKSKITSSKKPTKKVGAKASVKQEQKALLLKIKASIFLFVAIVLAIGFFYSDQTERFINFHVFGSSVSSSLSDDGLKVHFMDVGQADAIAIEFPNGKHMLVDAGESKTTGQMNDYLSSRVFTQGEEKVFDYFLLTHSDADHSGGAKFVFENFVVNTIYRPKIYTQQEADEVNLASVAVHDTATYRNFVSYANSELNEVGNQSNIVFSEVSLQIEEGGASILFLSPILSYYGPKKYNEHSPILLLEYQSKRIVLTGDATVENEEEMLDNLAGFYYDIDVLKLGHHGSSTSTSNEFLEAFQPEYAIISVGPKSKYGHPSDSVLANLAQNGILEQNIYSTFENGTVVVGISLDGESQPVLAIVCGYENEKPWVTWWQFYTMVLVVLAGALFAKELASLQKKAKKLQ